MTITPRSPFRAAGNTDRASFRAALSRTVAAGVTPPPLREADAIYEALAPHGLTRLGAGMAWIERRNETDPDGLAFYPRRFHNLWAVKNRAGGWWDFDSYAEAARMWGPYVLGETYADLTTIAEFISRYAPWSDGNDPDAYGRQLAAEINALPLVADAPPADPEPIPWSPVIYDLRNDSHAARFGLTPAERDRILAKQIPGRHGMRPEAIVLHVQWGWTSGSLRHWLGVSASSTIMVQQDGSLLRVIPEGDGPWTNGDVQNPDASARALMQRFGPDPNVYALTIEAEDGRTEQINAAQLRAIVWQIRQWYERWPHLREAGHVLGHYQINSVDRSRCGRYRGDVLFALSDQPPIPEPEPVPELPGLPDWLPADALRAAFPLADPHGVVTKRLIAWIAAEGELPYWVEKIDLGSGRNIWRFDRVTLFNDGGRVWIEGEAA